MNALNVFAITFILIAATILGAALAADVTGDQSGKPKGTPAPPSGPLTGEGQDITVTDGVQAIPSILINGESVPLPDGAQVIIGSGGGGVMGVELGASRIVWKSDGTVVEKNVKPADEAKLKPVLDKLR